jgi:hypothetical protein
MSAKSKKRQTRRKKGLDEIFRTPRGRRPHVDPEDIRNRADYYRTAFARVWEIAGHALNRAETADDVGKALFGLRQGGLQIEARLVMDLAPHIVHVLRDRDFPIQRRAQVNFLADSVAAHGLVSARRARDICGSERGRDKRHSILRVEFYIECSCGYSGPSRDRACPQCGAPLPVEFL